MNIKEDTNLNLTESNDNTIPHYTFRQFLKYVGPGFLICIAYIDPGNLASDLQAGRDGGYKLLWLLFWSTFLGLLFQVNAARLGLATGHNLA